MEIKLNDGTVLAPIMITGAKRQVQGAMRDTLQFVFSNDYSMDELDALFSEENCTVITIVGVNSETVEKEVTNEDGTTETVMETVATDAVYNNYSLRCELKKEAVTTQKESGETEATTEERVFVSMSQKTYTELQLKNLTETVDFLVLDSLL